MRRLRYLILFPTWFVPLKGMIENMDNINVLISETKIEKRLNELAKQIMKDYGDEDLVFVVVLKGAATFMIELAKRIKNSVEFEFIQAKSYEGTEGTGKIEITQDLSGSIEGKNVIIIEDIIDTGRTLEYLMRYLTFHNPKSIKLCTLLSKPSRRLIDLKVDYVGFSIPDEFVIGFGLDYNQKYRNLPYIGVLK